MEVGGSETRLRRAEVRTDDLITLSFNTFSAAAAFCGSHRAAFTNRGTGTETFAEISPFQRLDDAIQFPSGLNCCVGNRILFE